MSGAIFDRDFWTRPAECARSLAEPEPTGNQRSTEQSHTPARLRRMRRIVIAPRIPPGRTKEPKSPTNSWNRLATKLRNKNTYVVNKLFRPAGVTYQIWVEAKGCEPFWAQLGSTWKPKLIQNPSKPSPNRFQIWFQKQLPPPSGFQTGHPQK